MIWSDWIIEERSVKDGGEIITPFRKENLQPNSYDVTLGDGILVETAYSPALSGVFGKDNVRWKKVELPYRLKKGDFILGTTAEYVKIPKDTVAFLEGKSTNARNGLCIHMAGFIDSGFEGNITLEMSNLSNYPFVLEKGMKIGQLVFFDGYEPEMLYGECGNHYQGQVGTTPAWKK